MPCCRSARLSRREPETSRSAWQLAAFTGAAGVIDLLTAAVAEYHGAVLLHYDADFEHIAAVTGQAHKWIVPRGTIT